VFFEKLFHLAEKLSLPSKKPDQTVGSTVCHVHQLPTRLAKHLDSGQQPGGFRHWEAKMRDYSQMTIRIHTKIASAGEHECRVDLTRSGYGLGAVSTGHSQTLADPLNDHDHDNCPRPNDHDTPPRLIPRLRDGEQAMSPQTLQTA
jgi:hypothetical protein